MPLTRFRKADPSEYDLLYRMGFEAWSSGQDLESYLVHCRQSLKYQQGVWYVLEGESGELCSSLITYSLAPGIWGIGSVATPVKLRRQGFASIRLSSVVSELDLNQSKAIFLFSDIDARFYEKFGFVPLPAALQAGPSSVCMVRVSHLEDFLSRSDFFVPKYF